MTSPTLLIALRGLGKTDGKALIKSAVKELIALGVLDVETIEEPKFLRGPRRRLVLAEGPNAVPRERLLIEIWQLVTQSPSELHDGRVVRDLAAVAKHLAKQPDIRRRTRDGALAELVSQGLVRTEERRVLGVIRRHVHVRTPAGDALLQQVEGRRRRGTDDLTDTSSRDGSATVLPYADDRDDRHGATDSGLDGAFDSSFDGSFDSAFDSSFDSAFDSGFSSGDGGGGDGGGGGGDGGGGGGGGD